MDWTGRPEEKPPREYGYFVAGVRDDTADRHGAQKNGRPQWRQKSRCTAFQSLLRRPPAERPKCGGGYGGGEAGAGCVRSTSRKARISAAAASEPPQPATTAASCRARTVSISGESAEEQTHSRY